jgi:hypothetical protein
LPAPTDTADADAARRSGHAGQHARHGADRNHHVGADGAFTFGQVPAGQYVLQVDANGFERRPRQ